MGYGISLPVCSLSVLLLLGGCQPKIELVPKIPQGAIVIPKGAIVVEVPDQAVQLNVPKGALKVEVKIPDDPLQIEVAAKDRAVGESETQTNEVDERVFSDAEKARQSDTAAASEEVRIQKEEHRSQIARMSNNASAEQTGLNPLDQSYDPTDVAMLRQIRQALIKANLSWYASNAQIVVQDTFVHLSGFVTSLEERQQVEGIVKQIISGKNLVSELKIWNK